MEEILLKLKRVKTELETKIDALGGESGPVQTMKNAFEQWKVPWTSARAEKLDNLDAKVSTRAAATDLMAHRAKYTPERAEKLDYLDTAISSRADGAHYTQNRAERLDNLDATVSSRSTQASVDELLRRGTVKRVQRGELTMGSTGGWNTISGVNGVAGYRYQDITLPYAVDVNKSVESAQWVRAVGSGSSGLGVLAILIGPNELKIKVHENALSSGKLLLGIEWMVVEYV